MPRLLRCGSILFDPDMIVSVDLDVSCCTPSGTISSAIVRMRNSSPLQFTGEDADVIRRYFAKTARLDDLVGPTAVTGPAAVSDVYVKIMDGFLVSGCSFAKTTEEDEPTADPGTIGNDKPVNFREFT